MQESLKRLRELTEQLDSKGPDGKKVPEEVKLWMSTRQQTIILRRVPDERVPA